MLFGSLAIWGLGSLATYIHNRLAYKSLEPYTAKIYSMKIPYGWSPGETTHKQRLTQVEFFDGSQDEPNETRVTNLELIIIEAPTKQTKESAATSQARVIAALTKYTDQYRKDISCQKNRTLSNAHSDAITARFAASSVSSCTAYGHDLTLYAQSLFDKKGNLIVAVLQARPDIWREHRELLVQSVNSVEVKP